MLSGDAELPCRLHSTERVRAVAGGTFFKNVLQERRDHAAGVYQVPFGQLSMVICPFLLIKQHKTQADPTLHHVWRVSGQQSFTFHVLR